VHVHGLQRLRNRSIDDSAPARLGAFLPAHTRHHHRYHSEEEDAAEYDAVRPVDGREDVVEYFIMVHPRQAHVLVDVAAVLVAESLAAEVPVGGVVRPGAVI